MFLVSWGQTSCSWV